MGKKRSRLISGLLSLALVLSMFLQAVPEAQAAETVKPLQDRCATTATEVLYEEDFDGYGAEEISLDKGENPDYNLYVSGGSASIKDGRLYFSGSSYHTAYIMGGEMWAYYTVEADICYTNPKCNWVGLSYYVQSSTKWQKGSIKPGGVAKLNGFDGGWVNDINGVNTCTVNEIADDNLTEEDVIRLKIVANGKNASMYYARYDAEGVLGEYQHVIDISNIPAGSQSGSVGIVVANTGSEQGAMWVDNLKVTRNTETGASKHTLLSVDFDEYTGSSTAQLTAGSDENPYGLRYTMGDGSTGSVQLKDGRMYMSGNKYDAVYFSREDAKHWRDYVVEADLCYTEESVANSWYGMMYRVQEGGATAQKGTLYYGKNQVSLNGFKNKIGSWDNDNNANGIAHKPTNLLEEPIGANAAHRLRIVVNGSSADMWYALYDDQGKLGQWTYIMSINDISDAYEAGTVGFMTSGSGNTGSFWVDNVEVYEYAATYVEDFAYGDTILSGEYNKSVGMQVYQSVEGGTVQVKDGALEFQAAEKSSTQKYDMAWFTAGTNWTNYSFEADVSYVNGGSYNGSTQWGTLLYRVTDETSFQRGGLSYPSRVYLGGYLNGWKNNAENYDKWTLKSCGAPIESLSLDTPFRVKIVAEDNCSYLYYALYDTDGALQPYTFLKSIDLIPEEQYSGSVGLLGAVGVDFTVDNIVVSAGKEQVKPETEPEPTYNLADIAVPETGIVNPPVIIQQVTDQAAYNALKNNGAAAALLDIDVSMNIVDSTGAVIATAEQFLTDYRDTVIPAFRIDSGAEVDPLIAFLNGNELIDAFVVAGSDDCDRLKAVRTACPYVRGILEYDAPLNTYAKRAASRRMANNYMASVILAPEGSVDAEISAEYNARAVNIWSYASDTAGVYSAISGGYNGVVSTKDANMVTEVYEQITATTLSGIPMAIGHRGRSEQDYPENTLEAYRSAYEDCGAAGIEIDLKLSKDGEIVIMHDGTVDRTTDGSGNVSDYTVEELKQFTVSAVKDPAYTDKIPTLEEIFQRFQGTDLVIYCHMGSSAAMLARFKELVTKYGMEDNVIAFCRYNTTCGYSNSSFGDGLSFIGGNSSGPYDPATGELALDSQDHAIESMIKVFSVYNHQAMPYEYDEVSNSGKDDSYYYKMSARGFLGLHSTTNTESTFDRYFITGAGIAGALTDYPNYASDYCIEIDAADETLTAGEAIQLEKTVKKVKGDDITKTCGIEVLSGELTGTDGTYTMNEAGSAAIVYYADITAADSGVSYRLYSRPVTITFEASTEPGGDAELSTLSYTVGESVPVELTAGQLVLAATEQGVTIKLPCGTALDAEVILSAAPNGMDATVSGDESVTLENGAGKAVVTVTAADGTTKIYTVNFVIADSTDTGSSSDDDDDDEPSYRISTEKTENGSVKLSAKSAVEGRRVVITVVPDDGYELDSLTVTDKNGKEVKVTLKDGKYMFTMPKGAVTVEAAFAEVNAFRFNDVADGYWAENAIYWAYENGLMAGKTSGSFQSEGEVSRQQTWMILGRHCGYAPADMAQAKTWAVACNISDGTAPGSAVTRQQLVTLLYRYADMMGYDVDDRADLSGYSDCDAVSDYAQQAMSWGVANGIINGTSRGTLDPHGTATRAQFAAIMARFCDKMA